ncbi:metallo-dependent phosphatase-like protein [Phanerochaete sordida]|uniref:Metallo-dependent phosphatase-like protein n=1 Tax=Phanerochaete sordida TaxID=48140 RepID=A0A9P3GQS1_9APHY|nr:metallo-dependent phosphatase-like protein [Phanerochaete sordida]
MQLAPTFFGLLALCATALACPGEDHDHADHAHVNKREFPSVPLTPPTRPLTWGDLNIIHTTDTHGWLLGHQKTSFPEPNYSGDFGDFASFVSHMKEIALEKDVDLLLVDSGDLHDGTGLSDGFPAGGVDAHESNKFIAELPYDVMSIGNHELYIYANTLDMYQNFVPKLKGRYLSSNVNITVAGKDGKPVSVPVGNRSVKFKTRKGRKVTSLGVLYDFTDNDHNTTVQRVQDMVKENWFKEAIAEQPDLFLLVGHMPVQRDNWPAVFNAVRAVHPTTPILILGGHSHVRDCVQLDGRAMSLESGRYMETVGWMSVDLDERNQHQNLTFSRRYLDPNRVTYEFHSGRSNRTFDTLQGRQITSGLQQLSKQFDLEELFGTAPHDFTLSRDPFPSNDSALSLLVQQALPVALAINNTRANIPNIIISNSGELRFDIYAGPFTKNDQLTTLPFADSFLFLPNISAGVAKQVLPTLNGPSANERKRALERRYADLWGRGHVDHVYRAWLADMDARSGRARRAMANLTLGYVTHDACPGAGDDILHAPLPFFDSPDYVGSDAPNVTDDTPIDLVFINFIEDDVLSVLNGLQTQKNFSDADVLSYSPILANEALGLFALKAWN